MILLNQERLNDHEKKLPIYVGYQVQAAASKTTITTATKDAVKNEQKMYDTKGKGQERPRFPLFCTPALSSCFMFQVGFAKGNNKAGKFLSTLPLVVGDGSTKKTNHHRIQWSKSEGWK